MTRSPHPQWASLDIQEILTLPTALFVIDPTNSVLSPDGAQTETRLWERSMRPDGSIERTRRLVSAARASGHRIIWFRYEFLRDHYPANLMDTAQYRYRTQRTYSEAEKAWESSLVDDLKGAKEPEDIEILYKSFGNVFIGTPLQPILTTLGIRTILISGYHLEECVEQAARTARDLGFMPIVVGDCCLCNDAKDEPGTLEKIDKHWAPVLMSTELVDRGKVAFAARA